MKESKYPSVLVFSPIHDSKNYIIEEFLEHLSKLTYPNHSVLIVSTSVSNFFNKRIEKTCNSYGFKFLTAAGKAKDKGKKIAGAYNTARQYLLQSGFDYLCCMECDNFPPVNRIEKLINASIYEGYPVVITPYFTHYEGSEYNKILLLDRFRIGNYSIGRNVTNEEAFAFMDGSVKMVHGGGMGFCVIESIILENIKFTAENGTFQDANFFNDCVRNNIPVGMDTSLIIKHINKPKFKSQINVG